MGLSLEVYSEVLVAYIKAQRTRLLGLVNVGICWTSSFWMK